MRVTYDRSGDAAYIYLKDVIGPGEVATTYTCDPSEVGEINLDFDAAGRLIRIEILEASEKLPRIVLRRAEAIG